MDNKWNFSYLRNFKINLGIYRILDHVMCLIIVTPCVVMAFRAIWILEDIYFFPNDLILSAMISLASGHLVILILTLVQDLLSPIATDPERRPAFYLAVPMYKLIWSIAYTSQWRCVWILYGFVLGEGTGGCLKAFLFSSVVLSITASFPTAYVSIPLFMTRDTVVHNAFQCITRYETKFSESPYKFILDSFYSVFIIQSMVVVFWRAGWTMLDVCCYKKLFTTLPMGLSLTLLIYFLQDLVNTITGRLQGFLRLLFQNICSVYTTFCCVIVWHDVWNLMDLLLSHDAASTLCSAFASHYILAAYFDLEFIYGKSVLTFMSYYHHEYRVIDVSLLAMIYLENCKEKLKNLSLHTKPLLLNKPQ